MSIVAKRPRHPHEGVSRGDRRGSGARALFRASATALLSLASIESRAQEEPVYGFVKLTDEPAPAGPDSGKALIVCVRELYVRMAGMPDEAVLVGGEPAGLLPQRTWFAIQVASGWPRSGRRTR